MGDRSGILARAGVAADSKRMGWECCMSATSHADMERDHRAWRNNHARWVKEMSRWQAEHQAAVLRLEELQSFIIKHGGALRAHARPVFECEQALARLESQLSQGHDTVHGCQDVNAAHRQQAAEHERLRDAHERIRRRHDAIFAGLNKLINGVHLES